MRHVAERGREADPGTRHQPIEAAAAEPDDCGSIVRRQSLDLVGNEGGTLLWREDGKRQSDALVDADGFERGGAPRSAIPGGTTTGPMGGKHACAEPDGRSLGMTQLGKAFQSRIDRVGGQRGRPLGIAQLEDEREPVQPPGMHFAEGGALLREPRVRSGVGCGLVQNGTRLRHAVQGRETGSPAASCDHAMVDEPLTAW